MKNVDYSFLNKDEILAAVRHGKENIVFLSGSLIEGIGNNNSDIDVYVLVNNSSELEKIEHTLSGENMKFVFSVLGSNRLDVEYWDCSDITEIIGKINNMDFNDTNIRARQQLDPKYISLFHGLIIGYPIFNESKFDELIQSINLKNYYKWAVRCLIADVDNVYEDVIGNYELGDYKTAYLMCNLFVTRCLQGYLLSKSISIIRDKWVFKKLGILAETDDEAKKILSDFESLFIFVQNNNDNDIKKGVESSLKFVNRIINIIQNIGDGI